MKRKTIIQDLDKSRKPLKVIRTHGIYWYSGEWLCFKSFSDKVHITKDEALLVIKRRHEYGGMDDAKYYWGDELLTL